MSYYVGIDVDTKAIHAVFVEEDNIFPPKYLRLELTGHDAWERVRNVRNKMRTLFFTDCIAIGLENPAGRAGTGLYAVMRTTGAVLACLPPKVLVQPWRPAEWRKANGIPGNASKDVVGQWANQHRRVFTSKPTWNDTETWPQDACDAYCIALATRTALETQAT